MKKLFVATYIIVAAVIFVSCETKTDYKILDQHPVNRLSDWNRKLTQVIIGDVFSPPVCSRIYAYTNIAAYEALAAGSNEYSSFAGRLNQLEAVPLPEVSEDSCYRPVSSVIAFTTAAQKLLFNTDAMKAMEEEYINQLKDLPISDGVLQRSIAYGKQVGEHIITWAAQDGYIERNANPAYLVTLEPARWQPTPPDYMDAVEPNWGTLRSFTMDSSAMFRPPLALTYDSTDRSSFYKEAKIVYDAVNGLTSADTSIARYWDCNPNVSFTSGHVTYFQQQISPGGHWMHIAASVAEKESKSHIKTAEILSKVAISLADAFISCWEAKYVYNTIRPETFINRYIDKEWKPFIQTPPFPEYPSGHSFISASAASMLTSIFGDGYRFIDSAEVPFGRPTKEYSSFLSAAQEASMSRLYGGIHFLTTLNKSAEAGRQIGAHIIQKLNSTEPAATKTLILKR